MSTIFGLIIEGKLPSKKAFENERILAIEDIHPAAPVHLLIMPKKPIRDLQSVELQDLPLISEIVQVAQELAVQYGIDQGYRLLTNIGSDSGQTIFHLHFHLLGGRPLGQLG